MIQIIPQIASHLLLDRDYSIKHFRYILCVISFVVIFVVNTDIPTNVPKRVSEKPDDVVITL